MTTNSKPRFYGNNPLPSVWETLPLPSLCHPLPPLTSNPIFHAHRSPPTRPPIRTGILSRGIHQEALGWSWISHLFSLIFYSLSSMFFSSSSFCPPLFTPLLFFFFCALLFSFFSTFSLFVCYYLFLSFALFISLSISSLLIPFHPMLLLSFSIPPLPILFPSSFPLGVFPSLSTDSPPLPSLPCPFCSIFQSYLCSRCLRHS